ncbi:OmpA family protein [Cystobacter ferrugineus]|uniref:OmpA-like domain-containing protein n=1 Tax=Cystobacter ferrugineus TaxID=83449 RepID=A0A1L9BDF5_9BACT|nr:OmpA family protein [Cystobacter ferrugineus]OJH40292.1 hypothetical protein BON30_14725 [Cystobacter ferrugineus]
MAALLCCSTSWAQDPLPVFELERLEINPGRGSLLSGNGELMPPGSLSVGLVGQYQHLPFVLRNGGRRLELVRNRGSAVVAGSYGVLPWLELGLQIPVVLWQQGEDPGEVNYTPLASSGLDTPVLQARLGLMSQRYEQPVDLSVDLAAGLPFGNKQALAADAGMRFRARATVGMRMGWLHPALEAGVLLRPRSPLAAASSSAQGLEVGLGALLATTGTGPRGELALRGAFATDTRQPSVELLGGVRLPLSSALDLSVLGGPGVGAAPGTPIARVLLGVSFHSEPPPELERLTEPVPHFRLEEAHTPRADDSPATVVPVPTRELLPPEPAPEPPRPDTGSPPSSLHGTVRFEPGSTALSGDLAELRRLIPLLRSLPAETPILIEAQPAAEANEASDRLLPLRRAQAVRHHLAEYGIAPERMQVRVSGSRGPTSGHVEVFVPSGSGALAQGMP